MASKSHEIAIGGVSAATCLTILFCTGLVPFSSYALPSMASIFLIPVAVELGNGVACTVYCASSLLALLIVPDREAALVFVFLLGYYPILYPTLQKQPFIPRTVLKVLLFNCSIIGGYWVFIQLFGLSYLIEEMGSGNTMEILLGITILLGNVCFFLYDFMIKRMYMAYRLYFRKMIFGKKKRLR